ncbi:formyl transferase [Acrodontium crateriforme]|uniref:phosphoribosylglycinamide formyltransferase 1 n=1 Tax=Acrodontium crateriforme TaxID=150365 RepID=A0AAQ3MA47_9PEZI|nr:formyl transferase [Acrodontium crateriforme]
MATSSPQQASITVLISGSGSNLQALLDAANTPTLPNAKIIRVISDRKDAYGLKRAQAAHIPTTHHGILPYKKQHPDSGQDGKPPTFEAARRAYDKDLAELVLADHPSIVVCAGFMRILTPSFLDPLAAASTPVINLHPSLHGDLVGADCIGRAWREFEEGKREKTGIMVHYVIAEVDMGEPIVQQEVDIRGCATLADLEARMHETEHPLVVKGTKAVLEKKRQ